MDGLVVFRTSGVCRPGLGGFGRFGELGGFDFRKVLVGQWQGLAAKLFGEIFAKHFAAKLQTCVARAAKGQISTFEQNKL